MAVGRLAIRITGDRFYVESDVLKCHTATGTRRQAGKVTVLDVHPPCAREYVELILPAAFRAIRDMADERVRRDRLIGTTRVFQFIRLTPIDVRRNADGREAVFDDKLYDDVAAAYRDAYGKDLADALKAKRHNTPEPPYELIDNSEQVVRRQRRTRVDPNGNSHTLDVEMAAIQAARLLRRISLEAFGYTLTFDVRYDVRQFIIKARGRDADITPGCELKGLKVGSVTRIGSRLIVQQDLADAEFGYRLVSVRPYPRRKAFFIGVSLLANEASCRLPASNYCSSR